MPLDTALSLDNGFEADYYTEVEFFQQHSSYAGHALNLTQWPLVGAVLPPTLVDHNTTEYLLNNPDVLWGVDHLPDRIALVSQHCRCFRPPASVPNTTPFTLHDPALPLPFALLAVPLNCTVPG